MFTFSIIWFEVFIAVSIALICTKHEMRTLYIDRLYGGTWVPTNLSKIRGYGYVNVCRL